MWIKQRGNELGYKIIIGLYNIIGYKTTKYIIWFVSLFYALRTPEERKAIQTYYKKAGIPYSFRYYISHIYQFSLSIFDRFVAKIHPEHFKIKRVNTDHFLKKGNKIVALSHVGNWANTLVAFQYDNHNIHIVADEKLKASIVKYERSLKHQHSSSVHIINMKEGLKASIEIANALQKGDSIGMMVDRLIDPEKYIEVNFLDTPTRFNKNPFEMAYNRNIEIIGLTVIRLDDHTYTLIFSDPIRPDTSSKKEESIAIMANQYALYLESIIKQYPKQWFNFYNFWENA